MTAPLLRIEALNVSIRGAPILKDVSLRVDEGEVVGLVGASGSGKSMSALAVLKLLPSGAAMSGAVSLLGEALHDQSDLGMRAIRGRDVGMVFQEPMTALNPLMGIGVQVAETVRLHRRVSSDEARRLARRTLDAVGLSGEQGALDRMPYELSGGQRQRVAMAMAIALSPPLLIADEPTTALDVISQAQILSLLQDLVRSRRMGLLFITHDLAVVKRVAQRIVVMHRGAIVEQGATAEVLKQPRHEYTRALLGAAALAAKAPLDSSAERRDILRADDIVREYARKRRSLFQKPAPLRAVDGASLVVRAGETVGLVGESGSGKSSLLRVILALQSAQRGGVRLLGERFPSADGAQTRRLRQAVQVVFQDPAGSFDRRWSVERIIAEPFHLRDAAPSAAERRCRVAEVLEQVGLEPKDAARAPHEFSGGERQRIAIARALVTKPELIAFDEAVSALDVLVRQQILLLLQKLARDKNLAYLFVTHDLGVIRAIADRVYIMRAGRIVEEGTPQTLFASPQDPYTRALIDATPSL